MKKFFITIIMVCLIATPIFANPKPANDVSPGVIIGIISVVTLGIGYLVYKAVTNHDTVEFIKEEINLNVNEDGSVNVQGEYHFRRTGDSVNIFDIQYPFPDHKRYGKVEIESVIVNNKEKKYLIHELNKYDLISLSLDFKDSDECEMIINFTQYPEDSSYKYILKSTKKWKKELEESVINVLLPEPFSFESNYPEMLENISLEKNQTKFSMKKVDFYPETDFDFSWEQK